MTRLGCGLSVTYAFVFAFGENHGAIISYLERRYTALETEIADALRQSPTDNLAIADLKSCKRIIADEILHNRRLVEHLGKHGAQ